MTVEPCADCEPCTVGFTLSRAPGTYTDAFWEAVVAAAERLTEDGPLIVETYAPDAHQAVIRGVLTAVDEHEGLMIDPEWRIMPDQIVSITFDAPHPQRKEPAQ